MYQPAVENVPKANVQNVLRPKVKLVPKVNVQSSGMNSTVNSARKEVPAIKVHIMFQNWL